MATEARAELAVPRRRALPSPVGLLGLSLVASVLLWLAWIVYASIALARGKRAPAGAVAVPQRA